MLFTYCLGRKTFRRARHGDGQVEGTKIACLDHDSTLLVAFGAFNAL